MFTLKAQLQNLLKVCPMGCSETYTWFLLQLNILIVGNDKLHLSLGYTNIASAMVLILKQNCFSIHSRPTSVLLHLALPIGWFRAEI